VSSRFFSLLRRFRRNQRGQALVEFALVVPILLIMVMAIIDFGRAWNLHQTITDAAREGARKAVVFDPDVTQDSVLAAVATVISSSGFDPALATVGFPDGFKTGRGEPTTVTIEMPYRFGFLAPFIRLVSLDNNDAIRLRTYARMRNE
jgi:Flp pilus assembly protein TadG